MWKSNLSLAETDHSRPRPLGVLTTSGHQGLADVARAYGLGYELKLAGTFSFSSLLNSILGQVNRESFKPPSVVLVGAENEDALLGIAEAMDHGLIGKVALIGHAREIECIASSARPGLLTNWAPNVEIVPTDATSVLPEGRREAVAVFRRFIRQNPDYIIMKGNLDTGSILREALPMYATPSHSGGNGHGSTAHPASFTGLFVLPDGRAIALSDPAVIPAFADAESLVKAIENLLDVVRKVRGSGRVLKVAIVAAIEKATSAIPATVLAAETVIAATALQERYGPLVVEGPLSLDLAMVPDVATRKRYDGEIMGDADCLVATDINTANVLYKVFSKILQSFNLFVDFGGVVTAGPESMPIALTSRADSVRTKFNSILLALACSLPNHGRSTC